MIPSFMAFEVLGFAKLGAYTVQSNMRHNHMMKLALVLEDFDVHNNFTNFSYFMFSLQMYESEL